MMCLVCHATAAGGTVCPQCGYDRAQPLASDASRILAAREAFQQKAGAFAPEARVTLRDKAGPWLGLAVGFLLFVVWLKTCSASF